MLWTEWMENKISRNTSTNGISRNTKRPIKKVLWNKWKTVFHKNQKKNYHRRSHNTCFLFIQQKTQILLIKIYKTRELIKKWPRYFFKHCEYVSTIWGLNLINMNGRWVKVFIFEFIQQKQHQHNTYVIQNSL